jgi:hypothetical protein
MYACIPELENLYIREDAWSQQDGVLAHFTIAVREYVDEVCPEHWIRHWSSVFPAACDWSPYSPAISTWGNSLREIVACQCYEMTDDIREAVRLNLNCVTPQMLQKISHRTWQKIILFL